MVKRKRASSDSSQGAIDALESLESSDGLGLGWVGVIVCIEVVSWAQPARQRLMLNMLETIAKLFTLTQQT